MGNTRPNNMASNHQRHYTMEGLETMEEVDLEEAPLPPPPLPSSSPALVHTPSSRKRTNHRSRALATPVRALSLVVLMVGLLFAVHLLVHDLRTFVLLVAESLCIFFVMSCVAACERGDQHGAAADGAGPCHGHGVGTVAEVALLSFAMALTVTMTFWVATGLPLPAVVVIYLLSLVVVSVCFAVLHGD